MKKVLFLLLALTVCLSLCACGRSEAAKNAEALIDAIGTVSTDSTDAVIAAMKAYEDLSDEDAEAVRNHDTLTEAINTCLVPQLMGSWVYDNGYYNDVETMYGKTDLLLKEDMTAEGKYATGTWKIEDGMIKVYNGESNYVYHIYWENETFRIGSLNNKMIRTEEFDQMLDDMFLTVEITPENVADYCKFVKYTDIDTDDFGVVTGDTRTYITLESTVYDEGLIYFESSDDLAIEMLIPEHTYQYRHKGDNWRTYTEDADTQVAKHYPYGNYGMSLGSKDVENDYEKIHDITAEDVSFGRVTGKITYIRKEYVQEIKKAENGSSRIIVLTNGEELHAGSWREGLTY